MIARPAHPPSSPWSATTRVRRRSGPLAAAALAFALCACGTASVSLPEQDMIGNCMRNMPAFRGPLIECGTDAACPCGAFCRARDHVCTFDCWVPRFEGCAARRSTLAHPELRPAP